MPNFFWGVVLWALTLYLIRSELRIKNVTRSISRVPPTPHIPWWTRFVYMAIGAGVATAIAVTAVLVGASGIERFGVFQTTEEPTRAVPTVLIVVTNTPMESRTPTLIPSVTATLGITPIYAVTPTPPGGTGEDNGTPGWMRTPNGNGAGQFITPPGQGGVPPGQGGTSPSQGGGRGHTPEPKPSPNKHQ